MKVFSHSIRQIVLDGHNLLPMLTNATSKSPRESFIYVSDDGEVLAIRKGDWKAVFAEQHAAKFNVWRDLFVKFRAPKIFNLRRDSFERADTDSNRYNTWGGERVFIGYDIWGVAERAVASLKEFPPGQKPAAFNLVGILDDLKEGVGVSK